MQTKHNNLGFFRVKPISISLKPAYFKVFQDNFQKFDSGDVFTQTLNLLC